MGMSGVGCGQHEADHWFAARSRSRTKKGGASVFLGPRGRAVFGLLDAEGGTERNGSLGQDRRRPLQERMPVVADWFSQKEFLRRAETSFEQPLQRFGQS